MHGAELVTIDSRKTQISKLSRKFIQINPGTCSMFLSALSKVIVEDKLTDGGFIHMRILSLLSKPVRLE